MLASGATASVLMTVPVGRLFNHWGPGPINRISAVFSLSATAGLFLLPLDLEHIYCSMLIWILAGQSILFTTVGTYRGVGGIFAEQKRLVAFARMSIVSNLSDIVTPLVIGWLFYLNPNLIPVISASLAVTVFCIPQPKLTDITVRSGSIDSLSLLFICDLIIPITGSTFNLTSTEVGTILSVLALAQAGASAYLSFRAYPSDTLFKHFLNLERSALPKALPKIRAVS